MPLVLNHENALRPTPDNTGLYRLLNDIREYAHPQVAIAPSITVPGQLALVAKSKVPANSVIFIFTNEISRLRTRTSIQIGAEEHLEAGAFGSYTNHSCQPNAVVRAFIHPCGNIGTAALICITEVAKGEELTFDYATTETDLTAELKQARCLCGSALCRGKVKHFWQLPASERERITTANLAAGHVFAIHCASVHVDCH
jgi:hypothetical protein